MAPTILSQCNTLLTMRLGNRADQDIIKAIVADSSQGFVESLASLGNAEAVVVGPGVPVPMDNRLPF